MARCAKCGDEMVASNVGISEDALSMILIADHMLELWGLARVRRTSSDDQRTFAIEGSLESWHVFAHLGRILSKPMHDAAHNENK